MQFTNWLLSRVEFPRLKLKVFFQLRTTAAIQLGIYSYRVAVWFTILLLLCHVLYKNPKYPETQNHQG